MVSVQKYELRDAHRVWALSTVPNIGRTAEPTAPLDLPLPEGPPPAFPNLADIEIAFHAAGGDFLVVEREGHLVAMGGIRPNTSQKAEVFHVRVHRATRRQGMGRQLMSALERRAAASYRRRYVDTWSEESAVKGSSDQPPWRLSRLNPTIRAIRSSSAGQM